MRKLLVFPVLLAAVFIGFDVVGAPVRGARGTSGAASNNAGGTPVAARAAVRGAAQPASAAASAPVAARAAVKSSAKSSAKTTSAKPSAGAPVAARAGAKQKVISMGTKISTATANTLVSQDCQNAYFGCMDSFCMLENTTGGRCKCSEKNSEYDAMLEEIQKLDKQSYVMQTEGVSLLKMGKSADEVYAMAQTAADKVSGNKKEETTKKKTELSFANKDWFEDDEIFEEDDSVLDSDLTTKTGDKLHAAAARICTQQIPTECKASVSMLRMVYVQKIQSDCAAYENSLKQQRLESDQKLQTARQSLRDTALEKYQEANKYDLGGCVREFNTCMQKDDTCGEGFLGCVTFAATDNLKNNSSGTVAKPTIIKSEHSSITLAATTVDQLLSKKVFCESILDQCEKVKDQVWDAFLRSAAPVIKTAESDSEDSLRRNCIGEVSECFQTACKEQMDPNNPDGSFDMCLSNPDLYKSLCKAKLEPCLLATGGTYDSPTESSLWTALLSRLASMKVDACTKEVKDCLLAEERCGKDYGGCIGLSTADIGNLCPAEKLTACRDDRKNLSGDALEADIRAYVQRVAQGIALNIDNSMITHCQTALKTAMLTFCGAEDSCPNASLDENMFKDIMSVQLCERDPSSISQCSTDVYKFADQDVIDGKITPILLGKVDLSAIEYKLDNASSSSRVADASKTEFKSIAEAKVDPFGKIDGYEPLKEPIYSESELDRVIRTLNNNYKTIVNSVESDPKVVYCTSGRKVQGFDENKFIGTKSGKNNARFPNLTQNIRAIIAQELLVATTPIYYDTQQKILDEQLPAMTKAMSDHVGELVQLTQDKQNSINQAACNSLAKTTNIPSVHGCGHGTYENTTTEYNPETAICSYERKITKRPSYCWCGAACAWKHETSNNQIVLPKINKLDLRGGHLKDAIKERSDVEKLLK